MKRCPDCDEWEEICFCDKVVVPAEHLSKPPLLNQDEVEALRYARFVMGGGADFDRLPRDKCLKSSRTIDALLTRLGFER